MKEYIEREALIKEGWLLQRTVYGNGSATIESKQLKAIPAADVIEVRHGRWETVMLDHERIGCRPPAHYCSECNQITWFRTFYCPNCGAKMNGGVNDV